MWFFRFFAFIVFLGSAFLTSGFGCECAGLLKPTIREDIAYRVSLSKVVFEGQIESFQIGLRKVFSVGSPGVIKDQPFHYGLYKVRALRIYKGPKQSSFEIVTGIGGGDCGIRLQIGAKYLIYASGDQEDYPGQLYTCECDRTAFLDYALADLRFLRDQPPAPEDVVKHVAMDTEREGPLGTISGKITRSDGKPVDDLDLKVWWLKDGLRRYAWWAGPGVWPDSAGNYKMQLGEAGQFFVGATSRKGSSSQFMGFYENAGRMEDASVINVRLGERTDNVNFVLKPQPLYEVRGIVRTADGKPRPPGKLEISLGNEWDYFSNRKQSILASSGTFAISGVYPGRFQVMAQFTPDNLTETEAWFAEVKEILVPEQRNNVVITLRRGISEGIAVENSFVTLAGIPFDSPVIKVFSGDMVEVVYRGDPLKQRVYGTPPEPGKRMKIRIEGIDCPSADQPFGKEAKKFTADLVSGKTVYVSAVQNMVSGKPLKYANVDADSVARLIVDGVNVSESLLKAGLAWHRTWDSADISLARMEAMARTERRGIWSLKNTVDPLAPRDSKKESKTILYRANPADKLFHKPECKHYNCKNCSISFKSRDEALVNGFSPCPFCLP